MTFETALIAQAQPHIVTAKSRNIIRNEISKGCRPEISPLPVSLEPRFQPLASTTRSMDSNACPKTTHMKTCFRFPWMNSIKSFKTCPITGNRILIRRLKSVFGKASN
jgi:hypothetical protein